jgi:glycerol-3-phosphate dehydrogenase (NAD(P)+)
MRASPRAAAVIGGGSWGTALALHLAQGGFEVPIWVHDPERVQEMISARENRTYLPGFKLPETIRPSADLSQVLRGQTLVVWVVPARFCRDLFRRAAQCLDSSVRLVIATKGIEPETGMRMSEVALECLARPPRALAALAGPGFAREVARGDPTAGVLGCADAPEGERLQEELTHAAYRFYTNRDLVGVELGAALKNVIALAAGVVEGLGYGSNTTAALITRGLTEITRLAVACGGSPSTFSGLAGMGDLVLTCTGSLSRNRSVGVQLGQGKPLAEILAGMKMVAEGIPTTSAALFLARRHSVDLPITSGVEALLSGRISAREALSSLMKRPLKGEDAWE